MTHKLSSASEAKATVLLLSITYFISYITRNSYGVMLPEMVRQTGFSESALSLAVTGSFVTYGAGQLLSGYLGDRLQPKNLVFLGLAVTACMNGLIPFCTAPWQMLAVWCINGLAQAFLWPPIIRLIAHSFSGEAYQKATVAVTWGGTLGNIALYLIAPVMIAWLGFCSMFWLVAACGTAMAFLWYRRCPVLPPVHIFQKTKNTKNFFGSAFLWWILLAIILHGFLRDGVATWTPVYIDQTYQLGGALSILTGVALPVFHLVCIQGTALLHRRVLQSPILCAGVLFGIGAVFALLLTLLPAQHVIISVICAAMLTGCMHGVNFLLICILPASLGRHDNVSFLSGVFNACVYVGSAFSTYSIASVAEHSGWQTAISLWPAVAGIGMGICLLCNPYFSKITKNP